MVEGVLRPFCPPESTMSVSGLSPASPSLRSPSYSQLHPYILTQGTLGPMPDSLLTLQLRDRSLLCFRTAPLPHPCYFLVLPRHLPALAALLSSPGTGCTSLTVAVQSAP